MSTARSNLLAKAIRHTLHEAARSPSKRLSLLWAVSLLSAPLASPLSTLAADLPIPCVSGVCSGGFGNNVATAVTTGNTLTINQTAQSATLHWQSFNISSDGIVNFVQPNSSATAINRIYQNDPSKIFGTLNANGRVYLLNQNGIIFGQGAKVNVAGLVASSLDFTPAALSNGLAGAANDQGKAALQLFDNGLPSGSVHINHGAEIRTEEGGQVFVFAPNIVNEGNISTPGGQTLLAAGSPIYLLASTDLGLRGLLVEVGVGGEVTNGVETNATVTDPAQFVGQIIAERGNVTLAGLAVNQRGRITATTTVRENGSIRLQARDGGSLLASGTHNPFATNGGQLELAKNSSTEVRLDRRVMDDGTIEATVDATEQLKSRIQLHGHSVLLLEDAKVAAKSGDIEVLAKAVPGGSVAEISPQTIIGTITEGDTVVAANDGSRIFMAAGASVDVSGSNAELAMEHNVVRAELRGDELANSPVQREGVLRGKPVFVDVRESGKLADGTPWVGTPVGNVAGQVSSIKRDVHERNLTGGTVTLASQGAVVLAEGSDVNLSGGVITYRDGYLNTSQLLGIDGKVYDIGDADPNREYASLVSAASIFHARWGVTETFLGFNSNGRFESGYLEGHDAGTLKLFTPKAILDGNVASAVAVGRYQRTASQSLQAGKLRPFNQLPLSAKFIFGAENHSDADQVSGAIRFGSGAVLPTLRNETGAPFNPRIDVLPGSFDTTLLRSDLFGEQGIGRAEIHSNEKVELPENVSLNLGGQGELSIFGAYIEVGGKIHATGGVIELQALPTETHKVTKEIALPRLDLLSSAILDVSGSWVNDSSILNSTGPQFKPLLIDGGSVTLNATQGSIHTELGSAIDASAGAMLSFSGAFTGGDAGTISVNAKRGDPITTGPVAVDLGVKLQAFGFERGGTLSIAAPEICVSSLGSCGVAALGTLNVDIADLLRGGFGALSLISNERGLTVTKDTNVDVQQVNRVLNATVLKAQTGSDIAAIFDTAVLPHYLRAPTNLSLRAQVGPPPLNDLYNIDSFADAPNLIVESGAIINADPLATINLRSNTRIVMDGALVAPGGTIALQLDNTLSISQTLSTQGIWLGINGRLDASGVVLEKPNVQGLRLGEVLAGGRISLTADRGSIIANPGSKIDVSGTTAILDIQESFNSFTTLPTVISSNGGTVAVSAADAVNLSGELRAQPGESSPAAVGGTLRLVLDASKRIGDKPFISPPSERRIVVTDQASPVVIGSGTTLPDVFFGEARIAAKSIAAAGFDSVELQSVTTIGKEIEGGLDILAPGAIIFSGDVNLSAGRALRLDAARIVGDDTTRLNAPYVAVGHSSYQHQQTLTPMLGGTGNLQVSGEFIELFGNSTLDGFKSVQFASQGDLRLRGVLPQGQTVITGALHTAANLTLQADQIYAPTLTNFSVSLDSNPSAILRIESTAQERASLLSAGSHLKLSAPTIQQAGVLRAPFGSIELNAADLQLLAGSVTSTSAEGAIIPFGSTQAEKDWVYGLKNNAAAQHTLVVGDTTPVPEQRVLLNGENVGVATQAIIDISAGGDLLAYEFIPGTTGKIDVLSSEKSNQFAILPGLNIEYAPFDFQESVNSSLVVGDNIHLTAGVDGLAAGDYVLLPARYALLPGAFLIESVSGYTDLTAGQALPTLSGTTIVSGYRTVAGTHFSDSRTSGFAVKPASAIAKEARYVTSLASEFFTVQAEARDIAAPRLPQDAGVLSITAGAQLTIDGILRATLGDNARGAAVDISASNLRVANSPLSNANATANVGEVVVDAASLTRLSAESLLLGGRRSTLAEGTAIAVAANTVTIDEGVVLSAPEIMLAANDILTVRNQAAMTAVGELPQVDTYLIEGDGAFLRLAAGEQAEIRRSNEVGASGTLILEAGAKLSAVGGALALDASLDSQSKASLALQQGSLSLGASRVSIGAAPTDTNGLILSSSELNTLNLRDLAVVSRSTVDLYGDVALNANNLLLDAAGIQGLGVGGAAAISAADSITLSNRGNRTAVNVDARDASLQLNTKQIVIADGTQHISGFNTVALNAAEQVLAQGKSGVNVAGDFDIAAPTVLAATGAATSIAATGDLRVLPLPNGSATAQETALGGSLELSGRTVQVATRIEAAAGKVNINADVGDITLVSGAVLDAAGRERIFDGVAVAAPGGEIALNATHGNVNIMSGSRINLAGAGVGEAGSLELRAVEGSVTVAGQLLGAAVTAHDSGRVRIDADKLNNLSALNSAINAGGFNAERVFRQRGVGNLTVAAGDAIQAQAIALTADKGRVIVNGVIDASGDRGGKVTIAAHDSINIAGKIFANAESASGKGGEVALRSTTSGVVLGAQSLIDVSAAATSEGGEVTIRVPQLAALTLADTDPANDAVMFGNTIVGHKRISLEAFKVYTDADYVLDNGAITATMTARDSSPLFADANNFMSAESNIMTALGRQNDPSFRLLPGVEIQTESDISLGTNTAIPTNWDLSSWRFGAANVPGVLTLRAGANLTFNGSLSDGFAAAKGTATSAAFTLDPVNISDSWSYRLVAGADLDSADLLATNIDAIGDFEIAAKELAADAPSGVVADFRMVRTGNGSIDVAAAGDFILKSRAAMLYTAGVASESGILIGRGVTGLGGRAYPIDGGDITITVGKNVVGAQTNQLVTDWLWRVGQPPTNVPTVSASATAWTVNFSRFEQNVAALGGGDVNIAAGGDILNFSASIPSIGRQMGGLKAVESQVDVIGGGNLTVQASGSIAGGSFYVGLGNGILQAGSDLRPSTLESNGGSYDFYPILALGDGEWNVIARGSAGIEAVLNPTLLQQANVQGQWRTESNKSYFSTYAPTSATRIRAIAGNALLFNNPSLSQALSVSAVDNPIAWSIYPPTLRIAAFSNDIILNGETLLFPAVGSNVEFYADRNITRTSTQLYATNNVVVQQSDADPALLPSIATPSQNADGLSKAFSGFEQSFIHAKTPLHSADNSITHIVARRGDVFFQAANPQDSSQLDFATPVRIVAGKDIVDLPLFAQHDGLNDVSSLVAGGDIRYVVSRDDSGGIARNSRAIDIRGPGSLQLTAGDDVDLQTAAGITSSGNLYNSNLPVKGADISIVAGLNGLQPKYDAMIEAYLTASSDYAKQLIAYVEQESGNTALTFDTALSRFKGFGQSQQRVFLEPLLFNELRVSGREAAISGSGDYTAAFTALEAVFPGSNPQDSTVKPNAYDGDIALYFSRVYALAGGNVSLLAPGGEINVGLAAPPKSFGLTKGAAELGIVIRGPGNVNALSYEDFQVNESRVFSADGGNILVWSTAGDIDAGRGAKTAISAPPPTVTIKSDGSLDVQFPLALSGSGIQTLASSKGVDPGDVDLFAPSGVVNAGDAGIVAGNLTIGATAVLGADNIEVSGVSVGVPVDAGGLGASLSSVSSAASGATNAATMAVDADADKNKEQAPIADTALSWLEVFVVGLGEEGCKQSDLECLKRQK